MTIFGQFLIYFGERLDEFELLSYEAYFLIFN